MINRKIHSSMKLVSILIFLITLSAFAASAIEPDLSQTANDPIVKTMTNADFIANVMDYKKNTSEWVYLGKNHVSSTFMPTGAGPCPIASPILEELAQEFNGKIDVYKVNVDAEKELSSVFGIKGIPAFLYCPMEGKPTMSSGIANDKEQTKKMFRENIEKILLKK